MSYRAMKYRTYLYRRESGIGINAVSNALSLEMENAGSELFGHPHFSVQKLARFYQALLDIYEAVPDDCALLRVSHCTA